MKTIAIVYPDGRYLERLVLAMQKCLPEGYTAAGFPSAAGFAAWEEHVRVKALLLYEEICEGEAPGDRERLIAEITEAGLALRERALEVPHQVGTCVPLAAEEAAELYRLLYRVLSAFEPDA